MVNRKLVWKRVALSWLNTIVSLVVMAVVMATALGLSVRFIRPRVMIPMLMGIVGLSLAVYFLSEVIINTVLRARKPDPVRHRNFVEGAHDLFRRRIRLFGIPSPRFLWPRLRVLDLDVPNAMAYGWGILGQSCIGITEDIYELLTPEELKAVLAHELAHVRCRDVGIMTILSLIVGGAERLSRMFFNGKTALGKGPFALLIGLVLYVFAKLIFPIGRSAIAQEREYSADALGAYYVDDPQPLMSALTKLEGAMERRSNGKEKSVFKDLFISHPHMERRIAALRQLQF